MRETVSNGGEIETSEPGVSQVARCRVVEIESIDAYRNMYVEDSDRQNAKWYTLEFIECDEYPDGFAVFAESGDTIRAYVDPNRTLREFDAKAQNGDVEVGMVVDVLLKHFVVMKIVRKASWLIALRRSDV